MKVLLIIFAIGWAGISTAQQMALSSNYLFNEMIVNPGATGGKDFVPVQVNYRRQWSSFPGAPVTQSASAHSEIYKNMGFGGNIYNDASGPSRRLGMNINGAYHLKLDRKKTKYLGFGLGFSLAQHSIDVNKLTTYLPNDPAILAGYNNQLVPDMNFGVFYKWKKNAFVGLSAYNLVQANRNLFDFENRFSNRLARTYYLFAGYDFTINDEVVLKTSTLVQAIETGTVQFDVNVIGAFRNFFWVGLAYRNLDAIVGLAGVQIGQFKLGYSYDYTISDIGKYSSGSHEIFLEMQLYKANIRGGGISWFKRIRKISPKI